ncbi:MAG: hypothetical protein ABSF76_07755 [Opitutaceae bacterium]
MPSILQRPAILGLGLAAAAFVFAVPSRLCADDESQSEAPQLSDATGDGLAKLEPLIKDKDWSGAIKLVDGLLEQATPESYDQAWLNETEAQIFTQKGDYPAAIKPLETSLAVADRHHYFQAKQEADMLYFLSQLYSMQAEAAKTDHELQNEAYEKAISTIERWFVVSGKPKKLVMKLVISVHTNDSLYVFILATLQQEVVYTRAAVVLELLLSRNPNSKTYWMDLNMFYMALAQDPKDKDPRMIRRYNIRAINTIERAQALGFMKAPRDNYTLFTLYYNIGEFGIASDLLYNGLESGSIDSTMDNWLLLSASYQQINQDFKAIEVLEEASKRFPTNGELEFKIGQLYQGVDNNQKAFEHYKAAVEKGHLLKAQPVYVFLAYVAYELGNLDDAKLAIEKAVKMTPEDKQVLGLEGAIDEGIKERDAKKAPAPAPTADDKL